MEHIQVTLDKFKELSYLVIDQIKASGKKYDEILCPLRGGFFLSYVVSKHLDIPINYMEISSYNGKEQEEFYIRHQPDLEHESYLLCDDIYDSGKTIRKILDIYSHIDMDVACLISKQQIDGLVDKVYIGEYLDDERWIDFFWETL